MFKMLPRSLQGAQEGDLMARDDERKSIEDSDGAPVGLIVGGVVGVLFILFMLQNTDEQTIQFLFFEGSFPLWLALLLAAIAGAILGQLGRWGWRRRDTDD
jgi:uncharacterized integral membrane protein